MPDRFIGVQIGPQSFFDEGVTRVLDNLTETAHVNAVVVYTHTYYGASGRKKEAMAHDHGVEPKGDADRNLSYTWITHNGNSFGDTTLRHNEDSSLEYGDRDVFDEIIEPCRKRGVRVYGRILEPFGGNMAKVIAGWPRIFTRDCYDRIHTRPAVDHPDYLAFWRATVEDIVRSYPIDGFQWGGERVGPLSSVLLRGELPFGFDEHGKRAARSMGIDADRAQEGYRRLYELMRSVAAGGRPVDGTLVTVLRTLIEYPEILGWERKEYTSQQSMMRMLSGTAKAIRDDLDFGVHIDHQQSSYDPIYRASLNLSELAKGVDFVKPILYHDIAGPRIRDYLVNRAHQHLFADTSEETLLSLFYDIMGYDATKEPTLDALPERGLSHDYVDRQVRYFKSAIDGAAKLYAGIGLDIPKVGFSKGDGTAFPSDPQGVYDSTMAAISAGADGILLSREYGEMRLASLRGAGKALKEAKWC
jgi:hypothetical protein